MGTKQQTLEGPVTTMHMKLSSPFVNQLVLESKYLCGLARTLDAPLYTYWSQSACVYLRGLAGSLDAILCTYWSQNTYAGLLDLRCNT